MRLTLGVILSCVLIATHAYADSIPTSHAKCMLLDSIFNSKAFFCPTLNISRSDTIRILDTGNFFNTCSISYVTIDEDLIDLPLVYEGDTFVSPIKKILEIKKNDLLPYKSMDWGLDETTKKYFECYFIMQSPEPIGNLLLLEMTKIFSNQHIYLVYRLDGTKIELVDFRVSQY